MPRTARLYARLLLVPPLVLPGLLGLRVVSFPEGLLVGWALGILLTALAWWGIARRPISEMGLHSGGALPGLAVGLLLGLGWAVLPAELGRLLGEAQFGVARVEDADRFALSALALAVAAFGEEALFRGYVLGTLEERWAPRPALALGCVLFGAGHLFNPNAGPLAVATVLVASWALGVAYQRTRSVWLPGALHCGWNAGLALVLGQPVSGIRVPAGGVLMPIEGSEGFLGGAWGPEAGWAWFLGWAVLAAGMTWLLPPRRPMDAEERAWRDLVREG
ncbi:CPBP family intramembrane metalloprotease [Myxococcota bacterium]|nr:CPBP family intramembrane metalloprotease [Myxococcota bacterium]